MTFFVSSNFFVIFAGFEMKNVFLLYLKGFEKKGLWFPVFMHPITCCNVFYQLGTTTISSTKYRFVAELAPSLNDSLGVAQIKIEQSG